MAKVVLCGGCYATVEMGEDVAQCGECTALLHAGCGETEDGAGVLCTKRAKAAGGAAAGGAGGGAASGASAATNGAAKGKARARKRGTGMNDYFKAPRIADRTGAPLSGGVNKGLSVQQRQEQPKASERARERSIATNSRR
jgi:hypothetical protein